MKDKTQIGFPYKFERHPVDPVSLSSATRVICNKTLSCGLKLRNNVVLQGVSMNLRCESPVLFATMAHNICTAIATPIVIVSRRKGKEQIPTPISAVRTKPHKVAQQIIVNAVGLRTEHTLLERFTNEMEQLYFAPESSPTFRKHVGELRAAIVVATPAARVRRHRRRRLFSTYAFNRQTTPQKCVNGLGLGIMLDRALRWLGAKLGLCGAPAPASVVGLAAIRKMVSANPGAPRAAMEVLSPSPETATAMRDLQLLPDLAAFAARAGARSPDLTEHAW